jgi:hypothetical protein
MVRTSDGGGVWVDDQKLMPSHSHLKLDQAGEVPPTERTGDELLAHLSEWRLDLHLEGPGLEISTRTGVVIPLDPMQFLDLFWMPASELRRTFAAWSDVAESWGN